MSGRSTRTLPRSRQRLDHLNTRRVLLDIKGSCRVAVEFHAVWASQDEDHVVATCRIVQAHRDVGVRSVRIRFHQECLEVRGTPVTGGGIDDRGLELARLPIETDGHELHRKSAAWSADGELDIADVATQLSRWRRGWWIIGGEGHNCRDRRSNHGCRPGDQSGCELTRTSARTRRHVHLVGVIRATAYRNMRFQPLNRSSALRTCFAQHRFRATPGATTDPLADRRGLRFHLGFWKATG